MSRADTGSVPKILVYQIGWVKDFFSQGRLSYLNMGVIGVESRHRECTQDFSLSDRMGKKFFWGVMWVKTVGQSSRQ